VCVLKIRRIFDRLTALCLAARENHRKVVKLFNELKNMTIVKKETPFSGGERGKQKKG